MKIFGREYREMGIKESLRYYTSIDNKGGKMTVESLTKNAKDMIKARKQNKKLINQAWKELTEELQ